MSLLWFYNNKKMKRYHGQSEMIKNISNTWFRLSNSKTMSTFLRSGYYNR